ncbi:MAG: outer membrane protein assembly factor BamD [Bacteroidetes bacterium]|nr:MAG: outer membrane protein assembly factor BamD [Bacteroidota bacterium]MBL1145247.1 outer membrane protein assembly factor BamD [Bacteroidota bacterium]MCB0801777.1 outer membrane protein assembly factor BamD [Flavobacteriales bacterium]NOG58043.1 outer membrane protein assembly factor BamD [Bacteroidota bacterium]
MQKKYILIFVFLIASILMSCSEYQKVLKSPNLDYKYTKTVEYYNEGEYLKALPLLEELIPLYRGTDKGQEIYYYYCYSNYYLDFLITAAYHFKKYAETYTTSKYAEDALFMSAYCNYLDSPEPTLDQKPTYKALDELQLFVNAYPKSPLVDSANQLVDELRFKLEVKSFNNSKQYYKIRKYNSAVNSLNNTLEEYPGTIYAEEIKLLILKSYYYLALNSVEEKKRERFDKGIEAYYDFIDNFAEGKSINEAEEIYAKIIREREKLGIKKDEEL